MVGVSPKEIKKAVSPAEHDLPPPERTAPRR
jgi:hypothetical protein